jgi:hypothetical protein
MPQRLRLARRHQESRRMNHDILVLYYSRTGSTAQLARLVARGIEEVPGMRARLRQVPPVAPVTEIAQPPEPEEGAPYRKTICSNASAWRWAAPRASAIWPRR